jgi:hypothetical protein
MSPFPMTPTTPMSPFPMTPMTPDTGTTGTPTFGMSPPDFGSSSPPGSGLGSDSPPDYNDVGAAPPTAMGRAALALVSILAATLYLSMAT